MRPLCTWLFGALLLTIGLTHCKQAIVAPDPTLPTRDNDLAMGNPSQAGSKEATNYLLDKGMYVLRYNADRGGSNWVSWHLSNAWIR